MKICGKDECSIKGKEICCKDCEEYNECEDSCSGATQISCEYEQQE